MIDEICAKCVFPITKYALKTRCHNIYSFKYAMRKIFVRAKPFSIIFVPGLLSQIPFQRPSPLGTPTALIVRLEKMSTL